MPFTMLAVVLLLVSGSSMILISSMEESSQDAKIALSDLEAMSSVFTAVQNIMEDGSLKVLSSISSSATGLDTPLIQEQFGVAFSQWIEHYFPLQINGFLVQIENQSIFLDIRHLTVLEGDERAGSMPLFPALTGSYVVKVSSTSGSMTENLELERSGISSFPFLSDRMGRMQSELEGSRSEFMQMLSYQLSILAQNRALRGWGLTSSNGDKGTAQLLTTEDVQNAIEITLSVLEAQNFRSVASDSPNSILLESLSVDPAMLLLQQSWDGELELSAVLGQTLASLADSIVLQWLDYLHVVDVINCYEAIDDELNNFVDGLISALMGPQSSPAVNYIKQHMNDAGVNEVFYRYLYRSENDFVIYVPNLRGSVSTSEGIQNMQLPGGFLTLTLPAVDIFQWSGWNSFTADYRRQTDELVSYLRSFVLGICESISSTYGLGSVDLEMNPFSGKDLAQVMVESVQKALQEDQQWMNGLIKGAIDASHTLDSLGGALAEFIKGNQEKIFNVQDNVWNVFQQVYNYYQKTAQSLFVGPVNPTESEWRQLEGSMASQGLFEVIVKQLMSDSQRSVDMMTNVLSRVGSSTNPLQTSIANLARFGMNQMPGIEDIIMNQMQRLLEGISSANDLRSEGGSVPLSGVSSFVLYDSDGRAFVQSLNVNRDTNLKVNIRGVAGAERNTHHTGLEDSGFSPFSCVIEIEVSGMISHHISSRHDAMSIWGETVVEAGSSQVASVLQIPVQSAWPLQGVTYRPTNTLSGDMGKILSGFATHLLGPLDQAYKIADGVFESLGGLMMELNGYSTQAISALSEAVMGPMLTLQNMLDSKMQGALESLGGVVMSMGELSFDMDLYGLNLRFETNVFDLALSTSKNVMKVTVSAHVGDTLFSVALRLIKAASNEMQILITATMATNCWSAMMTIDPLMKVYSHFAEIKGKIGGDSFEVYLPKVTQYQSFRIAVSQMAGIGTLLSNIPLPMPGLKGSIDAGFDIKYNLPFSGNVVINEVELNPPGLDNNNEWVELFNPLKHEVRLKGWSIGTGQSGKVHTLTDGLVPAGGRYIVRFPGQFLNNGGGSSIPSGECIRLWDSDGRMVDSTPWQSDYYNDERTWQREFDGSDRWVFKESTCGYANGKASTSISSQAWLQKQITAAFMQAFAEYGNNIKDIDGVITVLKRTVELTTAKIIDVVANSLVESSFFLRIGVSDLSSAAHGGLELSILVTPEFIREGLHWIFQSMERIVRNIGNPVEIAHPSFITEHVHLRLAVFMSAGAPKFMTLLEPGMKVELQSIVECNLATLAGLLGMPHGQRSMGFGVVMRGVQGSTLPSFFNVDADKQADVWLIRGNIQFQANG